MELQRARHDLLPEQQQQQLTSGEGKRAEDQVQSPVLNDLINHIYWRRKWQPTPVVLPGKSHEQRSLVGYSLWGHKELDTTE